MANATSNVKIATVRRTDEFLKFPLTSHSGRTTYYPNSALGLTTAGYATKLDDTASLQFLGLVRGEEGKKVVPDTNNAGDEDIEVHQPFRFEGVFSSIARTDLGKKVYASDDQTFVIASSTTYGNLVGVLKERLSSTVGLIEPAYDGVAANARLGAARVLAATGAQTLTKFDLNKIILVPNTAALTITTPAVADTQAGDRLTILKSHASDTNAITIDPPSSETIDGATTLATLDAPYDTVVLVSTGSAWIVLSRDIA